MVKMPNFIQMQSTKKYLLFSLAPAQPQARDNDGL